MGTTYSEAVRDVVWLNDSRECAAMAFKWVEQTTAKGRGMGWEHTHDPPIETSSLPRLPSKEQFFANSKTFALDAVWHRIWVSTFHLVVSLIACADAAADSAGGVAFTRHRAFERGQRAAVDHGPAILRQVETHGKDPKAI